MAGNFCEAFNLAIWRFGEFASESPNLKSPIIYYAIHTPGNIRCENEWRNRFTILTLRTGNMQLIYFEGHGQQQQADIPQPTVFSISWVRQFFSNERCPNLLVNMMSSHAALHFKYIHTFLTFNTLISSHLHVSCSSSKCSHPLINLGVRLLETWCAVGESPNLKIANNPKQPICQI